MIGTKSLSTIVRNARPSDEPVLLEMCRFAHAESPRYRNLRFDQSKVEATIQAMVGTYATGPAECVLVSERGDHVTGVFGAVMQDHLFGPDLVAREVLFYVKPEHRGTFARAGIKLVRAFERWAFDRGALELVVGSSTMITPETTLRLYQYLGYHSHGFSMIKRRGE